MLATFYVNLAPTVLLRPHPQFGQILVGPTGLTLYTFARDQAGTSNCYDSCEQNWPPAVKDGAQDAPAPGHRPAPSASYGTCSNMATAKMASIC